ncbi:hypothetical protein [Pontixanthobacter aquaemixtae]|uniref:Uncharacterized protein n=1 Tax=Pontixanthobacter aquaemixtae TaxID=1958940 RepID=A0A844ZTA3_9SPHN|nr:hypothetical protein [Pontixanthobacter aquaemixtae]MXO90350.1 hypothetical protein [Pontixanthobacter aquaemixtae]
MGFDWVTLAIALGLAFVAWKVIKGMVKFAAIAAILCGGLYIYSQGYLS